MKFLHTSFLIFGIACSGYAQTTVCSGDSVVLILNGYKQGSTVWEQSSDGTTWSPVTGTAYKDSLIVNATTTNYYRAIVTDGTCSPFYSDTTLITVKPVPSPPTANPASNITLFFFDANWSSVPGATTYYIDVATDNGFTSFVSGYKNLQVNNTKTNVKGISCATTYYYRVRATDSCGKTSDNSNTITVTIPACPTECTLKSLCNGVITDSRDSKTYKTVQIGTQCWMAQNLNVGTAILGEVQQTPGTDNQNASIEKYCYGYTHRVDTTKIDSIITDSSKCATYGGLYLWGEMMAYDTSRINAPGPQAICPTGWHLPTNNEWVCLEMTMGDAATKSGFTALPGGNRNGTGPFDGQGSSVYFWSATESNAANAWYHNLSYYYAGYNRFYTNKAIYGFSVRCVKD